MSAVVPFDESRRKPTSRVPPHNLGAEESVLGAMLLSPDAVTSIVGTISADDFYKPAHGHIFDACVELWNRGERPDSTTVAELLDRRKLVDAIGGPSVLVSLQNATPAISNAHRYAKIVSDHATLRRLIGVAGEIVELGYAVPDDVAGAVDQAEHLLYRLRRDQGDGPRHLADTMSPHLELVQARVDGTAHLGHRLGFSDVDAIIGGLSPGTLLTIAARPGIGKTHMGAAIANNLADAGVPALIETLEMSSEQMHDRLLAWGANVDLSALRSGRLFPANLTALADAAHAASQRPIWMHADAGANLLTLRSATRRVAQRAGATPVVIVDYLQLLDSLGRHENRQTEVAELSRGLKRLALDLDTVVVNLAQLNRNVEARSDKRPTLADLRESGAVEQDSDVVAFLYRDEVYRPDTSDKGIAEVIVAKNRQGRTGTARLRYEPSTGRYRNLAHREDI